MPFINGRIWPVKADDEVSQFLLGDPMGRFLLSQLGQVDMSSWPSWAMLVANPKWA